MIYLTDKDGKSVSLRYIARVLTRYDHKITKESDTKIKFSNGLVLWTDVTGTELHIGISTKNRLTGWGSVSETTWDNIFYTLGRSWITYAVREYLPHF
jgi:hypothetical protein